MEADYAMGFLRLRYYHLGRGCVNGQATYLYTRGRLFMTYLCLHHFITNDYTKPETYQVLRNIWEKKED